MKTLLPVALLSLVLAASPPAARASDDSQPLAPSITVVGSGKASARPDMAQVQVGVVTQAPSSAKALRDNNDAMAKLFQALEARGIAKKDVRTANFVVVPQYKRGPHGEQLPEVAGYQVSNAVRVKVRQLDLLGRVLDDVVGQGANQVHGVRFAVAEPAPLLDEARRKALADARHKAELYAREAGVEMGPVLLIQEETPHRPGPLVLGAARAEAAAVPVAEGEQDFHASITVTYAIGKPRASTGARR
jgi:uncharacterized protein YggE